MNWKMALTNSVCCMPYCFSLLVENTFLLLKSDFISPKQPFPKQLSNFSGCIIVQCHLVPRIYPEQENNNIHLQAKVHLQLPSCIQWQDKRKSELTVFWRTWSETKGACAEVCARMNIVYNECGHIVLIVQCMKVESVHCAVLDSTVQLGAGALNACIL